VKNFISSSWQFTKAVAAEAGKWIIVALAIVLLVCAYILGFGVALIAITAIAMQKLFDKITGAAAVIPRKLRIGFELLAAKLLKWSGYQSVIAWTPGKKLLCHVTIKDVNTPGDLKEAAAVLAVIEDARIRNSEEGGGVAQTVDSQIREVFFRGQAADQIYSGTRIKSGT
jgi:hypothetical protein